MNLKIKIMDRQPQLSDEELKSYMDFQNILHQHNKVLKTKNTIIKSGVVFFTVLCLVAVYFITRENNVESSTVNVESVTANESPLDKSPVENESVASADSIQFSQSPEPSEHDGTQEKKGTETNARKEQSGKSTSNKKTSDTAPVKTEDAPSTESVYHQAEPVAGYETLFQYFKANLRYPAEAIKDSINGILTVSFIINPDGKADKIQIEKTLGEPFEKEAIKLIEKMPEWKPATLNGKPVKSKVTLPLTFELRKIENP